MDCGMAAGGPASAVVGKLGMIDVTDINKPFASRVLARHLGVASQTEVGIAHGQHLGVDGAMRIVANRAAFAQRRVLINERQCLFPMALGTAFI